MRNFTTRITLLITLASGLAIARAEPYLGNSPPRKVLTLEESWQDKSRSREIPVLICYPADLGESKEAAPVIVFSHGLGGSRETYRAYGDQWAGQGYVVIFPQHHGSDTSVIGHGFGQMLMGKNDVQAFIDRVKDIHFVIDQVELLNAGKITGPGHEVFKDKLDLDKIGMAGHSFGAITTQAIVGQTYRIKDKQNGLTDARVKAGIAMSGSGSKQLDQDQAFGNIKVPMFYMTGTKDQIGQNGPADRRTPFDHSKFADTFLLTLTGANHMTFAPREGLLGREEKEKFQGIIRETTTAFWDSYLKGDAKAKEWFTKKLADEVGVEGVFETKGPDGKDVGRR